MALKTATEAQRTALLAALENATKKLRELDSQNHTIPTAGTQFDALVPGVYAALTAAGYTAASA